MLGLTASIMFGITGFGVSLALVLVIMAVRGAGVILIVSLIDVGVIGRFIGLMFLLLSSRCRLHWEAHFYLLPPSTPPISSQTFSL